MLRTFSSIRREVLHSLFIYAHRIFFFFVSHKIVIKKHDMCIELKSYKLKSFKTN